MTQHRHSHPHKAARNRTNGTVYTYPNVSVSVAAQSPVVSTSATDVFVTNYATPQLAADAATGGKRLVFPVGVTYEVTSLTIPASCTVVGNNSTLKFPANSTSSSSQSDEILKVTGSNVTIDNLNFDGNASNQGATWSQHRHCIRIHGAYANTVVKNCDMTNIIGDGVYVNVSASTGTRIGPNNTYNGNHFNRNGVSVVTGTDVDVFDSTFTNCSRSGMPGAIDIEPNSSSETLSDIGIYGNVIDGGSVAGTGTLPGIVYSGFQNAAGDQINIHDNEVYGSRYTEGILIIGINGGPFNNATNINVYSNNVHGMNSGSKVCVTLSYWIGADVYNNTLSNADYGIYEYFACLGTSTGNSFSSIGVSNIVNDNTTCA